MKKTVRSASLAGVILAILVIWQLVVGGISRARISHGEPPLTVVVPTPSLIYTATIHNFGLMQAAMAATLEKALLGFGVGAFLASFVAILYALSTTLRWSTLPLAYAFQSFPVFGLVPVIVLAFGADSITSIAIIALLLSYFPILVTLDVALHRIPRDLQELGILWNASRLQMLRRIEIPIAMPALFVGIRLALPASVVGATVGELLGASTGVGSLVSQALYQLEPGLIYAILLEVAFICALMVGATALTERLAVPWARRE